MFFGAELVLMLIHYFFFQKHKNLRRSNSIKYILFLYLFLIEENEKTRRISN